MAEKIDRKQLKRPDEFQVVAGRAMSWMVANRGLVLGVAGAVIAAVLIAWGVTAWRSSREAKAGGELAEALELQSRPISGDAASDPGQQTFASKEEREKAVLAALLLSFPAAAAPLPPGMPHLQLRLEGLFGQPTTNLGVRGGVAAGAAWRMTDQLWIIGDAGQRAAPGGGIGSLALGLQATLDVTPISPYLEVAMVDLSNQIGRAHV